jgi:DNA-binding transcriptional MerR regulator
MTIKPSENRFKISELARAGGVPPPTIPSYVGEGLLTPPVKTSRNMAYYSTACINEIRYIQELQTTQYLPLSAIKLLLAANREGQSAGHLNEMASLMRDIFRPVKDGNRPVQLTQTELLKAVGLRESELKELEACGLLEPVKNAAADLYDDIDLRIAQIYHSLRECGLRAVDLQFLGHLAEVLRQATRKLHESIHRLPDHEHLPLTVIFQNLNELKELLAIRIYRQEFPGLHQPAEK